MNVAWHEIGDACKITAKEAKEKYNALRDKYTRMKNSLQKPSGSGRSRKSKKQQEEDKQFLASMSFLDPFIKTRKTMGNCDDDEDAVGDKSAETNFETSSSDSENSSPLSTAVTPSESSVPKMETPVRKKLKPSADAHLDRILKIVETPDDENDLFGATVAAQLKKMSPRRAAMTKYNIQKIMLDAVMSGFPVDHHPNQMVTIENTMTTASRVLHPNEY